MAQEIRVSVGVPLEAKVPSSPGLRTVFRSGMLHVEATDGAIVRKIGSVTIVAIGEILGTRSRPGVIGGVAEALEEAAHGRGELIEGRFVILTIAEDGTARLFLDRFGGQDLYYRAVGGGTCFATSLDLLPMDGVEFDPVAVAFSLTVYGYRPPKRHTIYRGVRRLGVGEQVVISPTGTETSEQPFSPIRTASYGERELHEYADALLEAVRIRASSDGNVVYLSSGWDSTSLLACLVHLFGARKVRAVIGRMTYAERSGVINQFELDRAKAVADFYGVPLEVVEFDYRSGVEELLESTRSLFRSQQLSSATAFNHWRLAEHVARTAREGEVVFAGEMSDGAHNLGFSQFVTIFHPVQDFREYSDKMLSYLFGPTFLTSLQNGTYEQDVVWRLFRSRYPDARFDAPSAGDSWHRTLQLLSSFFLRSTRLPFWSLENGRLLTPEGRTAFTREMEATYLEAPARAATPETLYAWYLRLYNSFHWQGSTVATLPVTAEAHHLRCALPFHDGDVQDFLSGMPESWGRGLDLRPTKYPLKWMLANRIKYPLHLQVGPHSYLYDVDPSFSHTAELLYGSAFTQAFKDRLRTGEYERWLDREMFDTGYVHEFVGRFLRGEEVRGAELSDLMALCLLTSNGSY